MKIVISFISLVDRSSYTLLQYSEHLTHFFTQENELHGLFNWPVFRSLRVLSKVIISDGADCGNGKYDVIIIKQVFADKTCFSGGTFWASLMTRPKHSRYVKRINSNKVWFQKFKPLMKSTNKLHDASASGSQPGSHVLSSRLWLAPQKRRLFCF